VTLRSANVEYYVYIIRDIRRLIFLIRAISRVDILIAPVKSVNTHTITVDNVKCRRVGLLRVFTIGCHSTYADNSMGPCRTSDVSGAELTMSVVVVSANWSTTDFRPLHAFTIHVISEPCWIPGYIYVLKISRDLTSIIRKREYFRRYDVDNEMFSMATL